MKRLVLLLTVALGVGLLSYAVTRRLATEPPPGSELAWLTREFKLSPEQAAQVERLHAAYQPVCARHCARIFTVRARLAALERDGQHETTDYGQAQQEMAELLELCRRSTRQHLDAVAAVMPPEEGRRYLALVGPKVSQHEHAQPFGLR